MNDELGASLVAEHPKAARFFATNVLETESIARAVAGSLAWIKETGFELGGVVAAAGVSTPAKVRSISGTTPISSIVEIRKRVGY